jgi:hypothetical protein
VRNVEPSQSRLSSGSYGGFKRRLSMPIRCLRPDQSPLTHHYSRWIINKGLALHSPHSVTWVVRELVLFVRSSKDLRYLLYCPCPRELSSQLYGMLPSWLGVVPDWALRTLGTTCPSPPPPAPVWPYQQMKKDNLVTDQQGVELCPLSTCNRPAPLFQSFLLHSYDMSC